MYLYDCVNFRCDFDPEDSNPFFLHDTPPHDNAPPYEVWLQKAEQFRTYLLDKAQTHSKMDRQTL